MVVGWEADILTDLYWNTTVLSAPSAKNHLNWLNHRTVFILFGRLSGRIDSFPQSNCINSSGQHSLHINNSSESQATIIISKSPLKCNLSALNHFWLVCSDIITVIVTGVVTGVYLSDHISTARPLPPQWSVQAHRKFSRLEDWSRENRLLDVSKNQETDGVQQQRDHNQLLICRVEFEKSGHLGILGSDFLARPVLVSSQ